VPRAIAVSARLARPAAVTRLATPAAAADDPVMVLDAGAAARKLKLGAARSPVILGGAAEDRAAFAAVRGAAIPDRLGRGHDWILLYAADRATLEASLHAVSLALASPGTLWIAYPKGSSKTQTDLTRDAGWDAVRDEDLRWLSLVAIDERWSAFSLRHSRPGEPPQDFR
jgi:hypothetical protein